jgi:molecular chaperone DnaJ
VARAADIRFNLEITLAEAFAGCRRTVSYQRGHACQTCDGTGEHGISRTRFCGDCHGSGRLRDQQSGLINCPACLGRGFFIERICPDCAGSGRDTADVSLQVKIPPGMLSGDDLRLSGQGEPATAELAAGDLFLTIIIAEHAHFRLQGRDLYLDMPVNALSLLVGGEISIPLPVGETRLQLTAASVELQQVCVSGQGYPGRGKTPAGDLHLALRPVFPTNLDAKQRKLLQQCIAALDSQSAEGNFPEIAAWRAALDL